MDTPNNHLPDRFAKCDTSVINLNPAELPRELLYAIAAAGGRGNLMVYSYLRCSSIKQLQGDSERRQLELINEVCWKYGLPLAPDGDHRDLGVSALKGKNKALGKLSLFLAGCRSGKIKRGAILLLESLDRLSREKVPKALQLVLEMINDFGVTIWTLGGDERDRIYNEDNFDLVDIIVTICIMSRAHEESVLKRERVMKKRAVRIAEAKATGQPFWKRTWYWLKLKEDGTGYDLIPDKVAEIQLIFQLAAKNWGAQRILKHLRAKGIKNWSQSHVLRTLRNPAVLGWWQPYRNEDGRKIPDGEPRENYYPRIIDQSLWDQVQILQDAKIVKHKMVAGRKALSAYPNNGGVLPGMLGLPSNGNGRLSELSIFTTSILLDESDENE